jgi:hypothetical protein
MINKLAIIPLVLYSFNAFSVDCPKAKIEHIQPEVGHIVYKQIGYEWRKLGQADSDAVKAMYSALLSAQMAGKSVMVRYPEGYNCNVYELSTPASVVRTYND